MEENVFTSSFKWDVYHCAEKREGKKEKIVLIMTIISKILWFYTIVILIFKLSGFLYWTKIIYWRNLLQWNFRELKWFDWRKRIYQFFKVRKLSLCRKERGNAEKINFIMTIRRTLWFYITFIQIVESFGFLILDKNHVGEIS